MTLEGEGKAEEAKAAFQQAWEMAENSLEKSVAAHYLARHQSSVVEKLKWDLLALKYGKEAGTPEILPSLFLNAGKCFEDLAEPLKAKLYYEEGLFMADSLPDDGYGRWVQKGLESGLSRLSEKNTSLSA